MSNLNHTTNDVFTAFMEAAEAIKRVPELEAEVSQLKTNLDAAYQWGHTVTEQRNTFEDNLIDALAKIKLLEVERDDYGFRNLELTEKLDKLYSMAGSILSEAKPKVEPGVSVPQGEHGQMTTIAPLEDPSAITVPTTASPIAPVTSTNPTPEATPVGEFDGSSHSPQDNTGSDPMNSTNGLVEPLNTEPTGQSDVGESSPSSSQHDETTTSPDVPTATSEGFVSVVEPTIDLSDIVPDDVDPKPYASKSWWNLWGVTYADYVAGGGTPFSEADARLYGVSLT